MAWTIRLRSWKWVRKLRRKANKRRSYQPEFEGLELRYLMSTVGFSSPGYFISESSHLATITVNLEGTSPGTITVDYETSDASADAYFDYYPRNGTITFPPYDDTPKTFTVDLGYQDTHTEANEAFLITLKNPSGASLAEGLTTVTIDDNDFDTPYGHGLTSRSGIAAGGDYVWATMGDEIARVSTSGTFGFYDVPSDYIAEDITAGSDGNLWFVATKDNNSVKIGKITTGGSVSLIDDNVEIPGSGDFRSRITLGPDGNVWFTLRDDEDTGEFGVGKCTPEGDVSVWLLENIEHPLGIAGGSGNTIWLSCEDAVWSMPTSGPGNTDEYVIPYYTFSGGAGADLAVGPDGTVWCARPGTFNAGTFSRITPGLVEMEDIPEFDAGPGFPSEVVFGPDGNLWFAYSSSGDQKFGQVSYDGTVYLYEDTVETGMTNLTVGPDGLIWFLDEANKVGRFDSDIVPFSPRGHSPVPDVAFSGGLRLDIPIYIDDSVVPSALVYRSETVGPRPIFQVRQPTDINHDVDSIYTLVTWNGSDQSPVEHSTAGHRRGDTYLLADQWLDSPSTGYFPWSLNVAVDYTSTGLASTTYNGKMGIVNRDTSPFGAGWSVAGIDQLVGVTGGMLYVEGDGDWKFFADMGNGNYRSSVEDSGTLSRTGTIGLYTFTYNTAQQEEFTFNDAGLLVRIDDAAGTTTLTYNGSNLLTKIETPAGGFATFTYSDGDISTLSLPGDRTFTFAMNNGFLTNVTYPDGSIGTYTYGTQAYDGGLLIKESHGAESFDYSYDPEGSRTLWKIDGGGGAIQTFYPQVILGLGEGVAPNASEAVGISLPAVGAPITQTFDGTGRMLSRQQANEIVEEWDYNSAGQVQTYRDALNHVTTFQYDRPGGDLIAVTTADGATTTFQYDSTFHKVTKITPPVGNPMTFAYDGSGRLTMSVDGLNNATYQYYDAFGTMTGIKDANNQLTQFKPDSHHRITQTIDPMGQSSYTYYDAAGNVTGVKDANNNLSKFIYDNAGRMTVTVDALNRHTTLVLDAVGNVSAIVDANNGRTSFLYDSHNRVIETIDALNQRTTFLRDAAGNVTGIRDANGQLTSFIYDSLNRMTVTVDPLGNRTTLLLDADGQVTVMIDANNDRTSFIYDSVHRQTVVVDPHGRTTTAYDKVGNVTGVRDANGNWKKFIYDNAGRMTVTLDGFDNRTTLTLDGVGNVVEVKDALLRTTTFQYDAANRLTVTIDALNQRTSMFYDVVGNLTGVNDANNHWTKHFYDALNRVTLTKDGLNNNVALSLRQSGQYHRCRGCQQPLIWESLRCTESRGGDRRRSKPTQILLLRQSGQRHGRQGWLEPSNAVPIRRRGPPNGRHRCAQSAHEHVLRCGGEHDRRTGRQRPFDAAHL